MAFVGRRRVGCGALRTPTITEEECGRGVRPGEDAASAFLGAAASVAAPSALQPSPRRSAAAASGPAKTLPLPPRRQKGLAPVSESCLQLDARPAPALYNTQGRAGWVEINSSIYVHLVVVEISFLVVTTLALCRLLILFSPEIGIASQARVRCCHVTSPLDGAFADAFLTSS